MIDDSTLRPRIVPAPNTLLAIGSPIEIEDAGELQIWRQKAIIHSLSTAVGAVWNLRFP